MEGRLLYHRTGCENMKHSNFLARFLIICSLIFVCCLYFNTGRPTCAAIAPESIGRNYSATENGLAVIGVLLCIDGENMSYAYDVWRYHMASGWNFEYAQLNSMKFTTQDSQLDKGYLMLLMEPSGSNCRSMILGGGVKAYMERKGIPDCYKIETIRFRKGEEISREYEYSDSSVADCVCEDYSLMRTLLQRSNLRYGGCNPDEISVEYNILTGLRIGTDKEIMVTADGATVTRDGVAYRGKNSKYYVVESLPEVKRPQDKYRYELEGWYTQPEGGDEVKVGTLVSKATRLYARWRKIPVTYSVTCVDLLKIGEKNVVLGTSTWEAEYGDCVHGSDVGDETQTGEYYGGREYTGCSSTVVDSDGATVYRYFKNSSMTVTCIDTVAAGPDTGQQLGNTTREASYTAVVSGGSFGCNEEVGAYYRGYYYNSSSTQKVGEQGCTVYRYFVPVTYDIQFVSNCMSGGIMSSIRNCYYGHRYTLTDNSFTKRNKLNFQLNAMDATCDTSYQYVYQDFAGWSDSPEGGVLYSDGCVVANLCEQGGVVKLYAIWSEKEVTVTAQPKRLGYDFVGWSLTPDASQGRKQFLIDGEEVLYAIWKPAPVKYHVEYYKQKLDQSFEKSAQYEFSAYTDAYVTLEDISEMYPGFFLDKGASRLSGKVRADGSLVLSAYFRRGEYTLDFDTQGGKLADGTSTLEARKDVYEREITIPDAVIDKKGYDFGGWAISKTSFKIVARPGEKYRMPNYDQTLFAVWVPKQNTPFIVVPFYENINGLGYIQGEKKSLSGTTDDTVEKGICVFYSQNLEKCICEMFGEGYMLVSSEALEESRIRGDGKTSVDVYLSRKKYKISYLSQTEDDKTIVIATKDAVYGQKVSLPESFEMVGHVGTYRDETGRLLYPKDVITVTGNKEFLIDGKGYYPEETKRPQDQKPVFPQESDLPQGSLHPQGTPFVSETMAPGGDSSLSGTDTNNGGADSGQISIISTWINSTPNPDEVAAVLAKKEQKKLLKKGRRVTKKGITYQVTISNKTKRTVKVVRAKKAVSKLVIPDSVSVKGYSYQVTAVKSRALANQKKLKRVVLGKNIKSIGRKAFYGSKKLSCIVIYSREIQSVGRDAWKKTSVGCRVQFGKECSDLCKKRVLRRHHQMVK